MILLSCLFPIKSDCFVFVLTVGAPNQAIKNSLSLNHYLTLINQNTWQKTWLSTKPVQDKPALLFSLEKAADALTLSLSSMLALWKPQFRKVRLWRVSQSPACSQFRFSEQLPSKGVTNPAATCSYSFILFPPHPLTQNLAKIQEHSASSESPPHCGRAEHRQGENSEEGAWCFHVPNLPCLRLWGWLSLRKQDIRNIPIYELWSQNDLLSFSLPRCGWNQPRNRAFNGKMMAHLSL